MSDKESLKLRLEDGEIDESSGPSVLQELMTESGIVKDLRVLVKDFQKADNTQNAERRTSASAVFDGGECNDQKRIESSEAYNSEKAYLNDQEIVYIEEDEMLCVRGASPVPFVVERLSYSRKSPLKDCDIISFDTTPPKRRRTSGKKRRKRTTPRKVVGDKGVSSDEHNELGRSNSRERSQSPQEIQDKLPQLCKFYLQDCCAKKSKCEYMHSEFPCKFYYMGIKCEDETATTRCKLSHGGSLSEEMLNNLTRHINTAPIDVLGQEFVDMRSKMPAGKINQMLQETQDNFTSAKNTQKKISSTQNESSKFFDILKEKLYFLNEDQLNGLQQLEITKVDDLLNLTLAQLNAIGIHATQIEAIQMSFVAGQDTDMRNILPKQLEILSKQKIPSFEVVCYNDEKTCEQIWYEQEEGPLVIDETNDADDDADGDKIPEEDDIIIDVVGDSNSDSYSSIIEEEINNVEPEVDNVSATDSPEPSRHFVIEETQDGLKVLPNSMVFVDRSPKTECSKITIEINKNEQEVLKKSEELQEEIQCSKNQDEVELDVNTNKPEILPSFDELQEKIHDEAQLGENIKELEVLQTPKEQEDEIQCPTIQNQPQLYKNINDSTKDSSALGDMIEKKIEIETLKDEESQSLINSPNKEKGIQCLLNSSNKDIEQQHNISQEEEKSPLVPIKSPNENKCIRSPHPENVVAEIDLTAVTPPRRSPELPLSVRIESEPIREYINPFQRKIISPGIETKKRFSPVKEQRKKYVSPPKFKQDHQMQGDNSSEDWDADEKSDIQSPSKEIASPDQSEDESTPFVADGTCPDLPRRTNNLDNYQPALEINAHLTYPPMEYKLYEIYMPEYEVNKPTLMEKLLKANSTDPRLKKFIEKEKNHGVFPQAEYSFFPPNISQCDPRLRPGAGTSCQDQFYNASRVLYSYLQRSQWYQELKSNLKIQINHSVSDLVRALNYFHKDPSPQKIFDLFQIECAGVLLEVMRNVGIFIDVNGNITEEANYKQLCAPLQQQQQHQQQHQLPQEFPSGCLGPQTKPGLLGFAPPGVPYPHQNNSPMSIENSFARQAFGHDCPCSNNSNDFQPIGQSFYVGGQYAMNRNQDQSGFDSGFQPSGPYQRQNQKRHFKRR